MAVHDFTSERLYLDADLDAGLTVAVSENQAHYLFNVLRLKVGAEILVFNGRDGEWRGAITEARKRGGTLAIREQTRTQTDGPEIRYLFAPLKHARLDYMVQKAVEMGVARLSPVLTRRTVPDRVNLERMRANAVEAAEQCGVLRLPVIDPPLPLEKVLAAWDPDTPLVFCDEDAVAADPIMALKSLRRGPLGVLIGPEGGFSEEERQLLRGQPFVLGVSLGPRIMRADTAAVAALTLVNATIGDWA